MSESALIAAMRSATCPRPAPTLTLKLKRKRRRLRPHSLLSEKLKEREQMHLSSTLTHSSLADRYKEQPQSAIEVKCILVCVFAGCPHGIIHAE